PTSTTGTATVTAPGAIQMTSGTILKLGGIDAHFVNGLLEGWNNANAFDETGTAAGLGGQGGQQSTIRFSRLTSGGGNSPTGVSVSFTVVYNGQMFFPDNT